jgi:hypothetical protein
MGWTFSISRQQRPFFQMAVSKSTRLMTVLQSTNVPVSLVFLLSYFRYMPPTAPVGVPCVAIVFARTLVRGEDCGIKPFLIELHNGKVG